MHIVKTLEQARELWDKEILDVRDFFRPEEPIIVTIEKTVVWFYTKSGITIPITLTEVKHLVKVMEFLDS